MRRIACVLAAITVFGAGLPARAAICVPNWDQGVVVQPEYPYTSCRWNGSDWDPPGATQMQLLSSQGNCLLVECYGWIGKLTQYIQDPGTLTWDNRVWRSKLGWRAEGHFWKDQCNQGTMYPAWGPTDITWDYNQGLTASISSVSCHVYR